MRDKRSLNYEAETPCVSSGSFIIVFYSQSFQEALEEYVNAQPGEATFLYAMSLAHAAYRNLQRVGREVNDKNIGEMARELIEYRERLKGREVFGPNTKLILFTHEEEHFNNDVIRRGLYERAGGRPENILCDVKGMDVQDGINENKRRILDAIRNAKNGPVSVVFSGHGSKSVWALSKNHADNLNNNIHGDELSINCRELGDALYESGNIANFNLLGFTCLGYNFLQNLFDYLQNVKGTDERPYFSFSAANKDRFSYGQSSWRMREEVGEQINDNSLDRLYDVTEEGVPINVQDLWDMEAANELWVLQDASFHFQGIEIAERDVISQDLRAA